MRKWVKDIFISLLLVGVAVLCIVRWQAWFGVPQEPFWPDDSIDYTFPTYSESVYPQDSLTILVLGDIHSHLSQADYDSLAARVPGADLILQTGDWLERGQHYYYQSLLREWLDCNLCGTPVIACPGNHEYSKGFVKKISPVWSDAFPHPDNGPIDVPGANYYVDFPQMRLIVIDTNPLARLVHFTRTLTWLCTLMQTADDRFVIVMMHHPVLSAGKGRFNPLIYACFRHALGQADLVIAGHDHSYMRRAPFVILNTAGNIKQQRNKLTAEAHDTVPVYGILSLHSSLNHQQSSMEFRVYRLDSGEMIDSLYVHHD